MATAEHDIAKAMRSNPEQGVRLLMERYQEPVYWHIRRLVVDHDDAKDAAQETFIRAFRHFADFSEGSSLTAWIYKIATREALRLIDRRKSRPMALDDSDAQSVPASQWVDYTDLEAVKLQNAIQSLPHKQQVTFSLRYYDEMDYAQIAEITETSAASAKANYHVAKDKIVAYMNSHD